MPRLSFPWCHEARPRSPERGFLFCPRTLATHGCPDQEKVVNKSPMPEEIKNEEEVIESEEEETEEEQEETSADADEESEKGKEEGEKEPDYKALWEIEQKKAKELEEIGRKKTGAIKQLRNKLRTKKTAEVSETEDVETEEGEEVEEEESSEVSTVQSEVQKALRTERLADALASRIPNADKRQLVRHYIENRLKSSGSSLDAVNDDIDLALMFVDKAALKAEAVKKAKKDVAEKHAYMSSGNRTKTVVEDHDEPTKEEKEIAAMVGMDPKKFRKLNKDASALRS